LDYFPEIQVSLEMVLLFGPLVYSLLVFSSARLSIFDFEGVIIINFGHFVGVLEEVLLEVSKFLLDDGFSFVLVYFFYRGCETFSSAAVARFWDT
jgi:hypothetical protein